jgi:transcription elongation factor Elf1
MNKLLTCANCGSASLGLLTTQRDNRGWLMTIQCKSCGANNDLGISKTPNGLELVMVAYDPEDAREHP